MHLVKDFAAYKKFFETGAADRTKAGIKRHLLTKTAKDRVIIQYVADDVATIEKAMNSEEFQKYLERKGAPETSFLFVTSDVIVKEPPTPPTGETFSLYLVLNVGDFAALERGFREREGVFAEQGVIAQGLHRSTGADGVAIVHFVGTAKDKLEALPKRKEFVELLAAAKTQGEVRTRIGVDVARIN